MDRLPFDAPLWKLVRSTASASDEAFFKALTRDLALALHAPISVVSSYDPEQMRMRTLSAWKDGDWVENFEYEVAGTPCGQVSQSGEPLFVQSRVRQLFSGSQELAAWSIDSYLGAPLRSAAGTLIGALCVMARHPIPDDPRARSIVDTFGARAGAELERSLTARELERQRAFLRQVLDINPSLIFAKDREGRFTLANQSIADVYGTTVDGLLGKTDADFNSNAEEVAFFRKMDLEVIDAGKQRFIAEEPVTDAAGNHRWVQTIKRPIVDDSGKADQVLGVATDITELKHAREDLLVQKQQETAKVQAELDRIKNELVSQTRLAVIGQVAASIAHELRNPLGSISNAVYYLGRKVKNADPKWAEYLDIIAQEVHAADRIVRNLLEMTRSKQPARETVDLGKVAQDVMANLRGGNSTALELELDRAPFQVEADPTQLRQVLNNLFTNAAQSLDGREGTITLVARQLEDSAEIHIRDTGPGVRRDLQEQIFEPLFTTKAKGTGLGLAICRQIMERHDGSIELEPSPRGAAFLLRLPRRRPLATR